MRWWLEDVVPERLQAAGSAAPRRLTIITGWGRTRAEHQTGNVRGRVVGVLREMNVPTALTDNPGRVLVDVAAWSWEE